jgi:hypothetical protein
MEPLRAWKSEGGFVPSLRRIGASPGRLSLEEQLAALDRILKTGLKRLKHA